MTNPNDVLSVAYIDIKCDDMWIIGSIHGATPFAMPRTKLSLLNVYTDGDERRKYAARGSGDLVRTLGDQIDIGSSSLRQVEPLVWECEIVTRGAELKVSIIADAPVWTPTQTPFPLTFDNGESSFTWSMLCPRGRAEGTLTSDTGTYEVSGNAYMDGHDGAMKLGSHLEWWKWSLTRYDDHNVIATSTKWKDQPLSVAYLRVDVDGVRELPQADIGSVLGLHSPASPGPGLVMTDQDSLAGSGVGLRDFSRWMGAVGQFPSVVGRFRSCLLGTNEGE